ncbi:MAG: DUF6531 domain-containing protein [Gaiellaceae bacterium]
MRAARRFRLRLSIVSGLFAFVCLLPGSSAIAENEANNTVQGVLARARLAAVRASLPALTEIGDYPDANTLGQLVIKQNTLDSWKWVVNDSGQSDFPGYVITMKGGLGTAPPFTTGHGVPGVAYWRYRPDGALSFDVGLEQGQTQVVSSSPIWAATFIGSDDSIDYNPAEASLLLDNCGPCLGADTFSTHASSLLGGIGRGNPFSMPAAHWCDAAAVYPWIGPPPPWGFPCLGPIITQTWNGLWLDASEIPNDPASMSTPIAWGAQGNTVSAQKTVRLGWDLGAARAVIGSDRITTKWVDCQLGDSASCLQPGVYPPCPASPTLNQKYMAYARIRAICAAEPVNTATGAYSISLADAKLSAPGLPFTFTRSYDSGDPTAGELGPGWTDSYSASIQLQSSGDVIARSAGGQQLLFTANADGTYKSPADSLVTLTKTGDGYELAYSDQTTLSFDQAGHLLSITDSNGNAISIGYDSNGLRSQITGSVGRAVHLTHNDAGLLTQLDLPDGRSVSYGYTAGLLTSVTDPRGNTTHYAYNGQGELVSIVDANGHTVVTNSYDDQGRVLSQTDALGRTTTFSYGEDGSSTISDARGHTWRYLYDENGNLKSEIDPDGDATSYAYDNAGNTTSVTDALGNKLSTGYDAKSNPTNLDLPDGSTRQATYNAFGDPISLTDGAGNTTSIEYDALGNPTLVTRADGSKASYSYDSRGLPVSYTNPSGATTSFSYNDQGTLASSTSALGEVSSYGDDASGNVTSFVDPRGSAPGANPDGYRWHETYDYAGDLTSLTDPLGDRTTFAYDAVGNLTSRTDPNGHTTSYSYDAANRLVAVTEPDNSTIHYTYDEVGNLISRTDALGRVTTYIYDAENRPVVVTSPTGKIWSLDYDAVGNMIVMHTPSGGWINYVHDSLGRVMQVNYSDGTPSVSYTYDAHGNRASMTDAAGTVYYH